MVADTSNGINSKYNIKNNDVFHDERNIYITEVILTVSYMSFAVELILYDDSMTGFIF